MSKARRDGFDPLCGVVGSANHGEAVMTAIMSPNENNPNPRHPGQSGLIRDQTGISPSS